ncbi:uncharacterized protein LOC144865632 [Branchiostoma floridae x Branchiostoma japonicum]
MSKQQEFICGLSHVVTIAVLPRLNVEELMFELNRRIQNLDKETKIKDMLVSILRDVILEEYRQWERKSKVSSPDETTIPVPGQEALQDNVLTAYAETMISETSCPGASLQSYGQDIVLKKENDTSSEVLIHTKELEFDTDQVHLAVPQQEQHCNMSTADSPTLPPCDTPMSEIHATGDSCIKEEEFAMTNEDRDGRLCHDELNIHTLTSSMNVMDTLNPMNNSRTTKPVNSDTPTTSCHLPPDHGDVHIKTEGHVSEDDEIGQLSQIEHYTDLRDTVLINSGHEQNGKDSSEETPLAFCQPTPDQDCENMTSLPQDNDSRIDSVSGFNTTYARYLNEHTKRHKGERPFMCGQCGYRAYNKFRLVEHMRKHTGEKPFKCNQCHYKTSYKRYLVEHMMRHSGLKPYKCKECVYSTAKKSDLTRHMRRHTGERPYNCQECDYKAKDISNLSQHMRHKHQ